jgi:hypothetical protein
MPSFTEDGKTVHNLLQRTTIREAGWNLWCWGAPEYFGANISWDPYWGDEETD